MREILRNWPELGVRRKRPSMAELDDFVEEFVNAIGVKRHRGKSCPLVPIAVIPTFRTQHELLAPIASSLWF